MTGTSPHPQSDAGASQLGGAPRRTAIVITGASEGIGLALSHEFAARMRMPILMIARRPEPLAAAGREVSARHGVETITLALDVTAADAPRQIDTKLDEFGLVAEIFINNAGIGLGGNFTEHTEEDIARLIDINVRALTILTRHVLPGMRERRGGSIINVASLGGFTPGPYQAAYYASKAYVVSLSRALAEEASGTGVHICTVTPGPVDTAFHAHMGSQSAFYRKLLPFMSAEAVARSTWRGWKLGFRVIQPGLFTPILCLLMRLTPWLIMVPVVGWLLKKRYKRHKSLIG